MDNVRFMSSSLPNLVDNLSERVHSDSCIDCRFCLDYMLVKDDQLIFKCLKCNMNHNKDFNDDLINRFASTYEFCDKDINIFIFFLRKAFIHMNTWIVGKDLIKYYYLIKKIFIVV